MKLIPLLSLLFLVSCGKNITTVTQQENAYDDSQVLAKQVLQDARIATLEARLNAFESNFDEVVIDFGEGLNNLENNQETLYEFLNENLAVYHQAIAALQEKEITPMRICNSNEYLLKTSSGVYAVYMISTNYGTYLGKLTEFTQYRTTDATLAYFQIRNGQIVCN